MAQPVPFSVLAEDYNGFLLQCSLTLEMQPHHFTTECAMIAYIISLLSGRALQWAETIRTQEGTVTQSLSSFIEHFHEVFLRPAGDSSIQEQLFHLRQNHMSVFEYSLKFRTLAAASGWNERLLLNTYQQRLDLSVRLHLAAYDDTIRLERLIQLSIKMDGRMQCLKEHQGPTYTTFLHQSASISTPEQGI